MGPGTQAQWLWHTGLIAPQPVRSYLSSWTRDQTCILCIDRRILLDIYSRLHWVFFALHRLSLVVAGGGSSLLWCPGFSCGGFSCGERALGVWASVVVACGLSS